MEKYFSCKEISQNKYRRKTKEVDIILDIDKDNCCISVKGSGDLLHHLIEDTAILTDIVAKKLNGHGVR
jgi:hypothetical protein